VKVREHRGGYKESMSTVAEIEPTMAAIKAHIKQSLPTLNDVRFKWIRIEPYGPNPDQRNGWDTHIVTITGYGVWGFTDGMPEGVIE
jgi:hypothetical protein